MRRRTVAGLVSAGVAAALIVGISVVWPGLDAQETPEVDTSVWALQTGDGRRYARVNTTIGELDTVRSVSNPSNVVQGTEGAYLFSDSNSKLTRIDEAMPVDLDEETVRASPSTPAGTTQVATAGDFAAYLTDTGTVFAGRLSTGDAAQIDPLSDSDSGDAEDDEDAPQYAADVIALDRRGMLFSYSSADDSVVRYDIAAGELRGRDPLDVDIDAPSLTAAGDTWALLDAEAGAVYLRGVDAAVPVELAGTAVAGEPDPDGASVYLADESSLVRVPVDGSAPVNEVDRGNTVLGTPAVPIVHDGEAYAAWLGPSNGGGMLWSNGSEHELAYGTGIMPEQRRPVFVATDEAVILNETRTGWVWMVPDGTLVASSQNWALDDNTDPAAVPSEEQLSVVIDPKPPIAEPDAFGVRAGSLATLPVLMNDHDPNEDVLSIDPASVTGLDPGFGSLSVTDDGQRLAVRVEPSASGSATFQYAVTDGTAQDGLLSSPTTVTLTVSTSDAPPTWCGVERCLVQWPTPEVARGGTVTVPVLPGWVDPDGDPLLLLSVSNPSGIGTVAATPGGDVVYQHSDDGSGGEQLIELPVTVADTSGQTSQRSLLVRVSPTPALTVQSFTVVDSIDSSLTVDVAPHVTGTAGALSVTSVRVLDDAAATATVVAGTTTFDFSSREPGTFRVGFTVTDGTTDATGTARVTMLAADAPAQLATSPVVAFVRPQEDATLDVFAAVSNPTRRVLLLSDVVADADEGASLSVDAVGQNNLRVSGSTPTGAPGRLGTVTYTVSDGTDDDGARVAGEATVYLLPEAPELAPIAVDDTVIVRAGAQIDIPVLDNDVSPAGGRPTINPASVTSTTPDALAFASADALRYLAPTEPGDYGVDYSVYTTGTPSLSDTATVRIRVLPGDTNRPPLPDTLEGRVLSGQSTAIDFDGFGMDPDGDVVTLDRILTQPDSGSATVSPDGESIVYTSVPGHRGQVTFRYRAVDSSGAAGEGTVRVGVLDADSNPSPVTFTDYVQVQAGPDNTLRVSPLANDLDPTRGTLRLTDVRPDLPATLEEGEDNPEYTRLADRVIDVTDTGVVLAAGEEPGTMSFLYDVESSSGNTGRGLIVVKVVRESVPDYPVVADTVLTAETREEFTTGVDVVAGKAAWSGGDVDDLTVSLWGAPDDVTANGRTLQGDLPSTTRLIPFAVTGSRGEEQVTTYAFLRVPGDDDLDLSLRAGVAPQAVNELESVSFDMADLVVLPRNATLEAGGDVRTSGSRAGALCTIESGTRIRYDAGAGAPWSDACQVPVRIAGTEEWTSLAVPVLITARDPQPVLRPASLTVGPGETTTFDLRTMTTWELRDDWDAIQYSADYSGGAFEVSLAGSIVTITGTDRAIPGTENAAVIGVTSHTAVTPARLILRVGAAPSTLPQGGATAQQCSQAAGSSCSITVIGTPGEVNPLPRTPLELVAVRPTGACVGVSFAVGSAGTVTASWTGDAPGATCSASFSVRDAQGRVTAAQRDGRLLLDLQGYPKAPASVRQTAYGDGTVTLRVDAGESRLAYPGLSGFVVRYAGQDVARCSADGVCPVIPAPNGEQRLYEAWAVNATGESRASVRTTAWAYDTPAAPATITARPQPNGNEGNLAALSIGGIDAAETGYLQIISPAGETRNVNISPNQTSVEVGNFRVGSNAQTAVTVTPFSRFTLPPGLGGAPNGQTKTVNANGVGAPLNVTLTVTSRSSGDDQSTVDAVATAQVNGTGSELLFDIVPADREWQCDPRRGGNQESFPGLESGRQYDYVVCVSSWYGDTRFGDTVKARSSVRAEQSREAPKGFTFEVNPNAEVNGQEARWRITRDPSSSTDDPPRYNTVRFENWGPGNGTFETDPGIRVYYEHDVWKTRSEAALVRPAQGSAPYQSVARWSIASCEGGGQLRFTSSSTEGRAAFTFDPSRVRYRDAAGTVLPTGEDPLAVPPTAASVDRVGVTVSWSSSGWNLRDATGEVTGKCTPQASAPTTP
ncbi:Ig-like domain-containing protein [Microbacterium sp. P05]|uniref:Ig-like domain-containing protein n=1 Tax=Microbacterium sp. P05 TaxID=3366948 RepID=UPI003745D398